MRTLLREAILSCMVVLVSDLTDCLVVTEPLIVIAAYL